MIERLQDTLAAGVDITSQQYAPTVLEKSNINQEHAFIAKLQRDVDRQQNEMKNMVPSSKYMQAWLERCAPRAVGSLQYLEEQQCSEYVQEVTAHKATKKELAQIRCISSSAEALKAEVHKREQQLVRWRTENASLKRKISSLEATVNKPHQNAAKVGHLLVTVHTSK